jgi:serpin B
MTKTIRRAAAIAVCGLCSFAGAKTMVGPLMKPDFALDLYNHLKTEDGNVFFSPISIQSALAMTAQGAKGETKQQILDALSIKDPAALGQMLAILQRAPTKDEPNLQLTIANALWAQQAYPFAPEYVKAVREQFSAEARELDFQQPDAARGIINKWVEEKTKDKIKDLLADGTITPDTRLVLTNAVYFNADWLKKFEKDATAEAKFHVTSDKTTTAKMMQQETRMGHFDAGEYHVVQLPYVGFTTSMLVIVPKQIDGLTTLEKDLTPEMFNKLVGGIQHRQVRLSLPQFEFEYATSLSGVLKEMGVKLAFDADKADFSAMTTAEKLAISDVVHKAYVKVDEKGTEAAGATAVVMTATAMPLPEDTIVVTADRPFLFVVRDDTTGAILFMGRIRNPAS